MADSGTGAWHSGSPELGAASKARARASTQRCDSIVLENAEKGRQSEAGGEAQKALASSSHGTTKQELSIQPIPSMKTVASEPK
jgi:hypothetical protein